ncbi:methyltransferase family protein [Gillisia sp. Hel_I_86]|uniref:class I SAM-dependent methyltransferase n=1 Tax=Gillisia sp. Hel_I_86 TaxID=1249981 RepID=UPI00119A5926|nr:class I SAM-dependent methyltransferase [Gillisia sp. Hel_I_86]TVZ25561.1 methyltransferase family protein [Gillisia sp. Hel_I_86]
MERIRCKLCGNKTEIINYSHSLLRCLNCKLIFSSQHFSQAQLEAIYNELYNADDPIYKRRSIFEYNLLKNGKPTISYNRKLLLAKWLKPTSQILEIGAGIGTLGMYIQKKFKNHNYTGLELDKTTASKARDLGINVLEGDFSSIKNFKKKYDLILMWEVLEHIQDLKLCLKLIYERLSSGGVLLFSVPNYKKKDNYNSNSEVLHQVGPPVHLNFFTIESLHKIIENAGFEVIKLRKKRIPYLSRNKSFFKMIPVVISLKFEGPTIFGVVRKPLK